MARSKMEVTRVNEPGGDLLDAKYFCKVEKRQKLDVVINLKASENIPSSDKVAQRYVILMDVSGSMDGCVQGDSRSLLERIKVFGNLFVDHISENTFVSIVTFSNQGKLVLPMTKMNSIGKKNAKAAIESMSTKGSTNISDGLFVALESIQNSSSHGNPTRDCIILFTDGQANEGIDIAKDLVKEYRLRVQNMGRANVIPVSAITIGSNQPTFMNEVSKELGSDSFYWLSETSDFEADMLLPMLIRELPNIGNVKLEISCQNGVTFLEDDFKQPSLQNAKQIDGKMILEVSKTFLDNNLQERHSTDYVELRLESMKDVLYQAYDIPENEQDNLSYLDNMNLGPGARDYLLNTSSYTNMGNQTHTSWYDAQESMINILGQQCRLQSASALAASAECVGKGELEEAKKTCQTALEKLEKIEKITEDVFGKDNPHCSVLQENGKKNFEKQLKNLTEDMGTVEEGRLTAMASSFYTEMPTSSAVFGQDTKQPFMPKTVEKNVKKILRKITNEPEESDDEEEPPPPKASVPVQMNLFDTPTLPQPNDRSNSMSSVPSEPTSIKPRDSGHVTSPAVDKTPTDQKKTYVIKADMNLYEDYDPDSLFFSSILPEMHQLDGRKKMDVKLDILKVIQTALYDE